MYKIGFFCFVIANQENPTNLPIFIEIYRVKRNKRLSYRKNLFIDVTISK